jgi:hypothetical protein
MDARMPPSRSGTRKTFCRSDTTMTPLTRGA